ncbi:MAG: hypothetical protein QM749_00375 [Aquabacterium sp.]
MAINTNMQGRYLYLKTTDKDGLVSYSEHTVYDPDLFMAARQREADNVNVDAQKDGLPGLARAEQITRNQYLARV